MNTTRFVKENRSFIDRHIKEKVPNIGRLNDSERYKWVINDEFLYDAMKMAYRFNK